MLLRTAKGKTHCWGTTRYMNINNPIFGENQEKGSLNFQSVNFKGSCRSIEIGNIKAKIVFLSLPRAISILSVRNKRGLETLSAKASNMSSKRLYKSTTKWCYTFLFFFLFLNQKNKDDVTKTRLSVEDSRSSPQTNP